MKNLTSLKIKSDLIGFVKADVIHNNLLLWDNCHFFCNKDLDVFYRPKQEAVNSLLTRRYDMMFDLTLKDTFSLRYLAMLCDCDFKVGRYCDQTNDLDLMIDISKEPAISYLIEQIRIYVPMLKN
jgi:hypothetical protein